MRGPRAAWPLLALALGCYEPALKSRPDATGQDGPAPADGARADGSAAGDAPMVDGPAIDAGGPMDASTPPGSDASPPPADARGGFSNLLVVPTGAGTGQVTGPGISCPSACSASLPTGTGVTLGLAPDVDSYVLGAVNCTHLGNECSLTLAGDTTVIIQLERLTLTLSIVDNGDGASGQVSNGVAACVGAGNSCTYPLVRGDTVTMTATPDASSVFVGWGDDCSGTVGLTCTRTVGERPLVVSVTFAPM